MRRTFAAMAVVLLTLAGCGGGGSHSATSPAQTTTIQLVAHPCDTGHYFMQCALTPPPPGLRLPFQGAPVARGVDFAWGGPRSCAAMNSYGASFGASYLSNDPGKDWTRALVDEFHGCGKATVAVRETTANRAGQGCAAGRSDASAAVGKLAYLRAPANQSFTMAIDFDASGPQVAPYFRCASQTAPGRVNAYGGYYPLQYLCAHGLVGHLNWQTYAWSRGLWLPASCAPLEQYLNDGQVDYDRAIAPNYGQWPYAAPKPPPPHLYCFGPRAVHNVTKPACRAQRAHVNKLYGEIHAIRRDLLRQGCRKVVTSGPTPVVRRGPNHDKPACRALFARGTADHKAAAKIIAAY